MKCPICSCVNFYVKDPEDEYETYEIELKDGQVAYSSEDEAVAPDIQNHTEAFCNKCSWHGKLEELTK